VGSRIGSWYDFATGEGGGLLELIAQHNGLSLTGTDFWKVVELAEAMVGIKYIDPRLPQPPRQRVKFEKSVPVAPPPPAIEPVATVQDVEDDIIRKHLIAVRIWNDAKPLLSSPLVATYYRKHRKIPIHQLGPLDHVLRWAPEECAIVALVTDIHTGEPLGIHRTFLSTITGDLTTPREDARKALGPIDSGVIRLSPDNHVSGDLVIGEGIETCLAAMTLGFVPTWATGSAGRLAKFPVMDGIRELTLLVDHDENGAGQVASIKCGRNWKLAGKSVSVIYPEDVGDVNDVLTKGGNYDEAVHQTEI
jgi:hypothetical protein